MFNVYYTDRAWPDSEVVDRVWHDNTKNDLYLELHGSVYQYRNVPESVFEELVDADSVGRYYSANIKGNRTYGPGSRLGSISDLREMRQTPAPQDVTRAQNVTGKVTSNVALTTIGSRNDTPQLSLVKDVPGKHVSQVENAYEFTFVLESDESGAQRKHTLKASSEDEALDKLFELGALLDQDIVPVSATVYYSN